MAYFPYVTFVSVVSFNDVTIPAFHSFATLTREILFLLLELKIHIFSPPCNILYLLLSGESHDFSKMAEKLVQFCDEALREVSMVIRRYSTLYVTMVK